MLLGVYSVMDRKAGAFLSPFFVGNDAVAVRAMLDCLRDPQHQFSLHAADFVLMKHGTYDNVLGVFEGCDKPAIPVVEIAALVNGPGETLKSEV